MDCNIIFTRRHPRYAEQLKAWEHIRDAYSGGEWYIAQKLIRHHAETPPLFDERVRRSHYFNYPRKIARLISHFIFSVEPLRAGGDAAVIEDFSRKGNRATEVMLQLSTMVNLYGMAWLLVDAPAVTGRVNLAQKNEHKIRPYTRALPPMAVTDWAFGDDGELDWAIVKDSIQRKNDPFAEPETVQRRLLWTRNEWRMFEQDASGKVKEVKEQAHELGCVPLVPVEESDGFGLDTGAHWFEDVVRISDSILNAESEAHMNIVKQMFGQLVVSEEFANSRPQQSPNGEEKKAEETALVIARSSALWETAQEKGLTRYISPDGVPTTTIRSEIQCYVSQLYDVVGLAIQSSSKAAQSAESKAWDSHNVQQFLANRASMLEQAEQRAWKLMHSWDASIPEPKVTYNRKFSMLDTSAAIAGLIQLTGVSAGTEFYREVRRALANKLDDLNRIPEDRLEAINKEIDVLEPEGPAVDKYDDDDDNQQED